MRRQPFIPDGLVGKWRFGDGGRLAQRGTVMDLSGKGNHGLWYGTPAIYFDGGTDYATIAYDPASGQPVFAVGMMVRLDGLSGVQTLYADGYGADTSDHRILLTCLADGTLELYCKPASGLPLGHAYSAAGVIKAATWHALLLTIHIATRRASAWVDGVAVIDNAELGQTWEEATWDGTDLIQVFGADLISGGEGTYPMAGRTVGVRIYGGATGPTLAAAGGMDANGLAMTEFGWSDYWRCSEGTGNPASNGSRAMTLSGVAWDLDSNLGQTWRWDGAAGEAFRAGARWLDGVDDYVNFGAPADLAMEPRTNAYSLVLWLNLKSAAPSCFAMAKGGSNGLYVSSSSGLNAFAGGTQTTPGTGDIRGALRQIAMTVPAASTGLQCYLDGAAVGSAGNIGTSGTGGQPLRVGGSTGYWLTGQALRAEFFNRVLTAQEVKSLYEQGPYR